MHGCTQTVHVNWVCVHVNVNFECELFVCMYEIYVCTCEIYPCYLCVYMKCVHVHLKSWSGYVNCVYPHVIYVCAHAN